VLEFGLFRTAKLVMLEHKVIQISGKIVKVFFRRFLHQFEAERKRRGKPFLSLFVATMLVMQSRKIVEHFS